MRRNLKRLLALAMVLALILSGLCDSRFQVLAQESTEAETEVLEEQESAEEEQKEDEASEVVEEPEIADVVEEPEIADVVEEPEIAEELEATGETADSGQAAEPDVVEASEGAEESEEAALNEAAQETGKIHFSIYICGNADRSRDRSGTFDRNTVFWKCRNADES